MKRRKTVVASSTSALLLTVLLVPTTAFAESASTDSSAEPASIEMSTSLGTTNVFETDEDLEVVAGVTGTGPSLLRSDVYLGEENYVLPEEYLNAEPMPLPDYAPEESTSPPSLEQHATTDSGTDAEASTDGEMGLRSVIGSDSRYRLTNTRVAPASQIPELFMTWGNTTYTCTAWLFGRLSVGTAAHCLYKHDLGGYADKIEVLYGIQNGQAKHRCPIHHTSVPSAWRVAEPSHADDWGVIQTMCATGQVEGQLGFGLSPSTPGGGYFITGYPADKPLDTMWEATGPISQVEPRKYWYTIDTAPGQSGSPIWKSVAGCGNCVHGIHAYGTGLPGKTNYNSGTRITSAVMTVLNKYKEWVAI